MSAGGGRPPRCDSATGEGCEALALQFKTEKKKELSGLPLPNGKYGDKRGGPSG